MGCFGLKTEEEVFRGRMIDLHNELRKNYNSPNLKENKNLNKIANKIARDLILNQEKNQIKIYDGKSFGENVIISESNEPNIIFKNWSDESQNYDFNKNTFDKKSLHFTQIIWKETNEIGISITKDIQNNKYCIVVLYYPPGNTLGEFSKNINNKVD